MEIYVEGIHDGEDGIVTNFEDKIIKAAKNDSTGYELTDLINDMSRFAIKKMGTAFAECIEKMFEIDDYGLSEENKKELKSDLYKWINDTNYDMPEEQHPPILTETGREKEGILIMHDPETLSKKIVKTQHDPEYGIRKNEDAMRTLFPEKAVEKEGNILQSVGQNEEKEIKRFADSMGTVFEEFKKQIKNDDSYAWSWHCNIAMASVDEGFDHMKANKAAARFMKMCFDVDTTQFDEFKSLAPTVTTEYFCAKCRKSVAIFKEKVKKPKECPYCHNKSFNAVSK